MKKSSPTLNYLVSHRVSNSAGAHQLLTNNKAFHLVLSENIYTQGISNIVIKFVCASSCGHDTEFSRLGPIKSQLLIPEMLHKLNTVIDSIGLKDLKVQSAARFGGMHFAREVYQLDE